MKRLQISAIILFILFVSSTRSESLTYYSIRDKWENGLFNDNKFISSSCRSALEAFKNEIMKPKINWALQMVDASTKLQPGFLYGNIRDYGSFQQCLEIEGVIIDGGKSKDIIGRHCMTNLPLDSLMGGSGQFRKLDKILRAEENGNQMNDVSMTVISPVWSICVPHVCDADDLNKLFAELQLIFDNNSCQTKNDVVKFDVGDILASVFFGLLLFLLIISTTYDIYLHYTEKKPKHILLVSFSALSNCKKLFTLNDNPSQLKCLDGLRFLSMMWVVLGHTYTQSSYQPIFNLMKLYDWMYDFGSMYIIGSTVSVDTFLLLSGLVMTYVFLMATQKGVKFNLILYYVHRYLRLTPALIGIIIVHLTFSKYIGSGPIWSQINNMMLVEPCQKAWWVTLLYLQNYVDTPHQCVIVSWYLAVDMQLFILSPLILFPLKKWPKYTMIGIFLVAFASVLCGFILAWNGEWVSLLAGQADPNLTVLDMEQNYYFKTHTRAAPWLIGIILGYFIFKHKNGRRFEINKLIVVMLWIASIGVLFVCVFGGYTLTYDSGNTRLASASHVAFVRPAWAIAICWVTYACIFGYGGPINDFLSCSIFRIGTRFTYSIYIVHYTFLSSHYASLLLPVNFSHYYTIHSFFANFILVFFISIIWTLIFESPILIIEKVLFGKNVKSHPKKIDNDNNTTNIKVIAS